MLQHMHQYVANSIFYYKMSVKKQMKVKNWHLQINAFHTFCFAIAQSISIEEYVAKSSLHLVTLLVLLHCSYISLFGTLDLLCITFHGLEMCFLGREKVPRNSWAFPRAKAHHMEVKHLGPHRHTNKQSPTGRWTSRFFLIHGHWVFSCAISLLVIRIFFILNNETCIWTCWSPALTSSHRTFYTKLLAAALSRTAICCTVASDVFQ